MCLIFFYVSWYCYLSSVPFTPPSLSVNIYYTSLHDIHFSILYTSPHPNNPANKASLEAPDILNWTPLHYAASYLSVSSLKLLLSEKANPNALSSSSSDRQSPILRVSTAQPALLIGEGKPFKTRSQFDSAVESCLEELLDKGADIEYEDSRKRSILHLASSSGNDKAVEIVLEKGFVVNSPCDADGNTPLHFACLYDRPTTVSLLINKGADVNAKNKVS